ncbi:hypothetical protein TWF730_006550 [Orbilia blumenaviensis]|uniref:Uncharacterized protein n=1 Tax=Orbilia blumenaviensis TaxID=1796055 RepID=A0AAV9VH25_9PEZI
MLEDLDTEELEQWNKLYEASTSASDIELFVYGSALLSQREGSLRYLNQAIAKVEEWVPDDHEHRNAMLMSLEALDKEITIRQNIRTESGMMLLSLFVQDYGRFFDEELAAGLSDDPAAQAEISKEHSRLLYARLFIPPPKPSPERHGLTKVSGHDGSPENNTNKNDLHLYGYKLAVTLMKTYDKSLTELGYENSALNTACKQRLIGGEQLHACAHFSPKEVLFHMGMLFIIRYLMGRSVNDLDMAMEHFILAARATQLVESPSPDFDMHVLALGLAFLLRLVSTRNEGDRIRVIKSYKMALLDLPCDDLTHGALNGLKFLLTKRFTPLKKHHEEDNPLEIAISDIDIGSTLLVIGTVVANETREDRIRNLPTLDLLKRLLKAEVQGSDQSRVLREQGLQASRIALEINPSSPEYLEDVAYWFYQCAKISKNPSDLWRACDLQGAALNAVLAATLDAAIPNRDNFTWVSAFRNLVGLTVELVKIEGDISLLDHLCELTECLEATPGLEPNNLGVMLKLRSDILAKRFNIW